jgi:hypothetical protein
VAGLQASAGAAASRFFTATTRCHRLRAGDNLRSLESGQHRRSSVYGRRGAHASQAWQVAAIWLAYSALYGAQQALNGLASKYLFDYPVNQVGLGCLGATYGGIRFRARTGITQRYHADAYPLMELSVTRDFGLAQPYCQITNASNTGYEGSIKKYRKTVRSLNNAYFGEEGLKNPTAEEWTVFAANCNQRDIGTHLYALPTGEHCPEPAGQIASREMEIVRTKRALQRAEELSDDAAAAIEGTA